MGIRVSNIRLGLDESEAALPAHFQRILGLGADDWLRWRILRKSLDARDKANLEFVYSVEVVARADEGRTCSLALQKRQREHVQPYLEPPFAMPAPGPVPLRERPIVVGSGPGGLAAAYFLAQQG